MKKDVLLIPLTYYYGLDSLFAFIKIETTCFMSKGLEQRYQTLFFIVVQRYLQVDILLVHWFAKPCLCEGLSDLSLFNQKYNWRSSSGD